MRTPFEQGRNYAQWMIPNAPFMDRFYNFLERMKAFCKEQYNLYEKQNDLKGQKQKIEKSLER